MSLAAITLSPEGYHMARILADGFPDIHLFLHNGVAIDCHSGVERFDRIYDLTRTLFTEHTGLIFVAPCGVVVRAIAPLISHKTCDPAVVVMDVGGRYAISLLSGHEGGANHLAMQVANRVGAEPIISTTSEARKNIIVGIGCRRNSSKQAIVAAIQKVTSQHGIALHSIRYLATADIKRDEAGLIQAAQELGIDLRLIPSQRIRAFGAAFETSELALQRVGLPAVAEPSAMLAGTHTQLIAKKRKCNGITIAIARENCLSSV